MRLVVPVTHEQLRREAIGADVWPWVMALSLTLVLRKLSARFVGQRADPWVEQNIRATAAEELYRLKQQNAIFDDLPSLEIHVIGRDISIGWAGYSPAATLPLASHTLLWEFLETQSETRNVARWRHMASQDVVSTMKAMEQDAEGRTLLVDFDGWLQCRQGASR